ncbi:MAG: glycosyltransferase [Deltaproteobacteria bacterium]|nr:glycosyltransferase [Deltaproteobacteria bacterium]MBW2308151.1 glycosyltransferase [Deltaproteobacteria bacterium]
MRGGEKCLEVFCELFQQAHVYTLFHIAGSVSSVIEQMPIHTTFIQRLSRGVERYRYLLPLFPTAAEQINLNGYDLILSSSHCVAKGIIPPPDALHICYCHTPMRYVWDQYSIYFPTERMGRPMRWIVPLVANYLRVWDVASSHRVDHFVANSAHVAGRIRKYYGREADVIYPPVDCDRFHLDDEKKESFYFMVTALAPYKRVDLAIEAFNRMGAPLVIIGSGQEEGILRRRAAGNITFLGWQPDNVVAEHYAKCRAFIFPGEEDFGITPVEAQAAGCPVVAFGRGGAMETVIPLDNPGQEPPTGVFFREPTADALIEAVRTFEAREDAFNARAIRQNALRFDRSRFKQQINQMIQSWWKQWQEGKGDAQKV